MRLNQLLEGLEVGVAPFAICEVRGQAGLVLEDAETASLHYVLSGHGAAREPCGPNVPLSPHTVLVMPPAARLLITSGTGERVTFPEPRCKPLPGGWQWMTAGEGAAGLVLACGALRATHQQAVGVFDYLREPLIESLSGEAAFRDTFRHLLAELAAPGPGTRPLAETMMKQCLIVFLRRHCEEGACQAPWLAALEHPNLGKVIAAMMDRPETPFTLEGLADIAGMSRAAFAVHFKETFGRPAMAFLKEVRLRRAAHLLTTTGLPVKAVAARVGFRSRSYFSRAFKAYAGLDPARFRSAAAAAPDALDRSAAE